MSRSSSYADTRVLCWAVRGLAGRVLTYVWGGRHPEDTVLTNPYLDDMRGKIIVLRSGDGAVGRWFREEIEFEG